MMLHAYMPVLIYVVQVKSQSVVAGSYPASILLSCLVFTGVGRAGLGLGAALLLAVALFSTISAEVFVFAHIGWT
jgi:hypothetical protein